MAMRAPHRTAETPRGATWASVRVVAITPARFVRHKYAAADTDTDFEAVYDLKIAMSITLRALASIDTTFDQELPDPLPLVRRTSEWCVAGRVFREDVGTARIGIWRSDHGGAGAGSSSQPGFCEVAQSLPV